MYCDLRVQLLLITVDNNAIVLNVGLFHHTNLALSDVKEKSCVSKICGMFDGKEQEPI